MITFFTTTKAFTGQNAINQLNAIRSWLQAPCPVEVIVFGRTEGLELIVKDLNLIHIADIEASDRGVPLVTAMFRVASTQAKFPVCCFLNADIILTQSFFCDIVQIHNKLMKNYLIVGQRLDVDVDTSINFSTTWETDFFNQYQSKLVLHSPTGSDYFVFPKGQYTFAEMPRLLVGRPGWDLWMIYNARKRNLHVIDLSFSSKVIHQNHDYGHKIKDAVQRKAEDETNYQYLPINQKYLYSLPACNYYYKNDRIRRNFARGDWNKYYFIELCLNQAKRYYFFKVRIEVRILKALSRLRFKLTP